LSRQLNITGAKAVKIKVGGRMTSVESVPGRTKNIVLLARKNWGDSITIYADANGSYLPDEGIKVGKMLEDNGVKIFEEPCAWEDNAANKKVADALKKMKLAGGEQDTSLPRFQSLINNRVYDVLQPDLYYNGGLLRCIQVARMAAKAGRTVAPHSPKADPLEAAMLQFASVVPNLEGFQEYPSNSNKQPAWYEPHFEVKNGVLTIPTGPGLGVTYDDAIWKKAEKITWKL
jgi:L-alanine-DL-glutamate epimerase-like enolase superfamily enzyme